jgi:hypothetical protein
MAAYTNRIPDTCTVCQKAHTGADVLNALYGITDAITPDDAGGMHLAILRKLRLYTDICLLLIPRHALARSCIIFDLFYQTFVLSSSAECVQSMLFSLNKAAAAGISHGGKIYEILSSMAMICSQAICS